MVKNICVSWFERSSEGSRNEAGGIQLFPIIEPNQLQTLLEDLSCANLFADGPEKAEAKGDAAVKRYHTDSEDSAGDQCFDSCEGATTPAG